MPESESRLNEAMTKANNSSLDYLRPDLKIVLDGFRRERLRIRLAMSAESTNRSINEAIQIWTRYMALRAQATLAHHAQPADLFYKSEVEFFAEADIAVQISLQSFLQAIQNSRFQSELSGEIAQALPKPDAKSQQWVCERTRENCIAERHTTQALSDIFLEAKTFCLGQNWSLASLPDLLASPQRSIRRAALRGLNDWLLLHDETLDQYWVDILQNRQTILSKIRKPSIWPLAWQHLGLGHLEIDQRLAFQTLIRRFIVPMATEIRRLQSKRLSLEYLQDYDLLCFLPLAQPQSDVAISFHHNQHQSQNMHPFRFDQANWASQGFFHYLNDLNTIMQVSKTEEDGDLKRLLAVSRWLEWLVWLTMSDEWMHVTIEQNMQDSKQRRNAWLDLETLYFPDVHHNQMPAFAKGGFSYLSFGDWIVPGRNLADAFSLISALAFAYRRRKVWSTFEASRIELIEKATQLDFNALLTAASLEMPWDETQFKQLVFAISSDLEL
ncbi:MAG: hypothetical protein PHC86_03270 [Eubacteriales bacterium]|nr:hypothetical protein [Eubacteriales bacterium]